MITLSVPGALEYRDVAVRVVGASCRLLGPSAGVGSPSGPDLGEDFATQVVSAFGEAFNNLAIHGYKDVPAGRIELVVMREPAADGVMCLVIKLTDTGRVFDPSGHLELPEEEPEGGMGLFIIRSFMDSVHYAPGPPNVLTLTKRFSSPIGEETA